MPAQLADAEGGITLAEENLANTLADCARFRIFAKNAPDRAAARQRIYIGDLDEPPNGQDGYTRDQLVDLRPFAIVLTANQQGYSKGRVGTGTYAEQGKLAIVFEENVPDNLADQTAGIERIFKNTIGVILDELLELAYVGPYLAIDLITLRGPMRCAENDVPGQGDHHLAMLELQYGVGVR